MRNEGPEIEIPEEWEVVRYRFSGNFQLIAEFAHSESGAEIRVSPYKTYSDQPGFCNAHRVVLLHPTEGTEEIAVGMEIERVEAAENAALEAMERVQD